MLAMLLAASFLAPQPLRMSAWVVYWDAQGLATLERQGALLSDVLAEAYTVTLEGGVARRPLPSADQRKQTLDLAKKHGINVYGMVSNFIGDGFKAEPVQTMLRDEVIRRKHIGDLVRLAREDGYVGLDIDIESLKAADRDGFTNYMRELRAATQQAGLKLSIAVHAKESEPGTWDGNLAQDWPALGALVDVFRVMTYDFSWSGSAPGPIAPVDWVERVARFAVTVVPAAKVEVGIPGYAYRWSRPGAGPADSLTHAEWTRWLSSLSPPPTPTRHASGELEVRAGDVTSFLSDAEAQRGKFAVVKRLGVRGFALWRLGSEDPNLWPLFRELR